jgi:RNase H-like domain found in reverse transcriptase
VEYLGLIVENGQVRMDPVKTNAITDWPTPTTKKELQSFLGFMNFYRRFIKDFAKVAAPLNKLTGKIDWIWEEDQQWVFNTLKKIVTSDPILVLPNETGKFIIECDASDYATGAILSQQQEDGTYRPVAFLSHAMTPAERNYDIHDKELLAIVRCFTAWRPFLLGYGQQTDAYSDHQNLTYFRQPQDLT